MKQSSSSGVMYCMQATECLLPCLHSFIIAGNYGCTLLIWLHREICRIVAPSRFDEALAAQGERAEFHFPCKVWS